MVATLTRPVPTGFEALPVLDMAAPDKTFEANLRMAALRAASSLCQVQPHEALGVLRWDDCDRVLRDPATFSSDFAKNKPVPGAEAQTTFDTLLWQDPPEQQRVRRLVQQAFTPQRVAAMEPHTRQIARDLIDRIMARGDECEFHHDFALPLPSYVMSGLLGVDESMMDTFNHWAVSTFHGPGPAWLIPDKEARNRRLAEIARDAHAMEDYLKERVAAARTSPGHDLVSYVVSASDEGRALSERQVLTLLKLFVIAGNDLTTAAIELTLHALATHPDQMRLLAADTSLAANAFEEAQRFQGPVLALRRLVTRDVEIAGMTVPWGCVVAAVVASANHDEAVFEHGELFDIQRRIQRILTFGSGIHQCLGQMLGRLEARVALEEWFARVSGVTLAGPPEPTTATGLRGFEKLPVTFERRARRPSAVAAGESGVNSVAVAERIAARSDADLGLDKRALATVRVAAVRSLTPTVKLFRLIHPSGGMLERFTPGSHVVVYMQDGGVTHRNAYSLLNSAYGDGLAYFIAVQRARESKGGSIFMHERVERGTELTISVPANTFPLAEHAAKHLLIAGGIGVTPMVAFRSALRQRGERWEVHYAFASAETAAFADDMAVETDPNIVTYDGSLGQRLDLPALIRRQPAGTHLYVCGPAGLMDQAIAVAEGLGWPPETIHFERFGAPPLKGEVPFEVIAKRSGKRLTVGSDETLLDALERSGIEVPCACRAGSCGSCQTRVLAGTPIHRDSVLTAEERAAGKEIVVCVSRARDTLTLDV